MLLIEATTFATEPVYNAAQAVHAIWSDQFQDYLESRSNLQLDWLKLNLALFILRLSKVYPKLELYTSFKQIQLNKNSPIEIIRNFLD